MKKKLFLLLAVTALAALIPACSDLSSMRSDTPLLPVKEYERMIVGRLDADYVGNDACLAKCHAHDKIADDFHNSVHGAQVQVETGLPLVNCESCHGPGSLAIEKVQYDGDQCSSDRLLNLGNLPKQAQSLICLKCHSASSTPVLTYWSGSTHATSDVSCSDCHALHVGPQQKVSRQEMAELCFKCHQQVRMEFANFSHHPVPEHKVMCSDCHDPHGTANDKMLKGATTRQVCTRCHMEYQGPFVYEHADLTENCSNCHTAHGSPNEPLLEVGQPFLCLQCHAGHLGGNNHSARGSLSSRSMKEAFFSRCTDCHSAIHGTDIPSKSGGTFIAR
ncbi:MAG: DmsE family decaheme c-type cytochrome [Desulfuromonadales bacterium]|nr:DmsE family decaheme c-type cytochrome [Desulfuromonadales bacterium]